MGFLVTSLVRNDLGLYDRHAGDWWNTTSAFSRSLHEVNRLRLNLIHERLGPRLDGLRIIDLGCGGGLLAEPLARAGAHVMGIDISQASLSIAAEHGRGVDLLSYVLGDARHPPIPHGSADVVLCADLLEHVDDWQSVLQAAAALLRSTPGWLFVTTINRTWLARALVVELGERLGFIPSGTHDPALFITPSELIATGRRSGLEPCGMHGITPRLMATLWSRRLRLHTTRSLTGEYAAWFSKRSL